eukprot:scaffold89044_cov67-Attheya_sp.AAC.3
MTIHHTAVTVCTGGVPLSYTGTFCIPICAEGNCHYFFCRLVPNAMQRRGERTKRGNWHGIEGMPWEGYPSVHVDMLL